ncbi:MAG: peptidoglycan-associated lipoprotein Pal [Candidatus Puniceispirillaceae bacterium]
MFRPILSLFAATFLLAACETASTISEEAAGQSDASSNAASSTSSSTSSSAASSSGSSSSSSSSASDSAAAEAAKKSELEMARNELMGIGDTVFFGYDSSQLSADAMAVLDAQAAFLNAKPSFRLKIEGHADERGTREYNLALGERRASATRDYLVARGVDGSRIRIVSYGKERPAVVGSNEEAWSKNRRSVTVLN